MSGDYVPSEHCVVIVSPYTCRNPYEARTAFGPKMHSSHALTGNKG